MKKYFIGYCLLSAVYSFSSCSSTPKEEATNERNALIAQVDSLQKKMVNSQTMELDKNLAVKGIAAYVDFVAKYPQDSLCAEYLFRASDLSRGVGDNPKSIDLLKQICQKYPDYNKIPDCIFLQGYYYQEFFKDTNTAKQFYQELLAKYPNHAFADDAQALMSTFGKTDEQMIKEFEERAKTKK